VAVYPLGAGPGAVVSILEVLVEATEVVAVSQLLIVKKGEVVVEV
jgi:hypothetical protein